MWSKDLSFLKEFSLCIAKAFFASHGFTPTQESRGYKFFAEGFIHDVWSNDTDLSVKGKCYHSQKRNMKPHELVIIFTKASNDGIIQIQECYCSCEVGLSQSCHHVVGLAFFLQDVVFRGCKIPSDMSQTSLPMAWNKPRGSKILAEVITNVTFTKPIKQIHKKPPVAAKLEIPKTSGSHPITLAAMVDKINKICRKIPVAYLSKDVNEAVKTTLELQGSCTEVVEKPQREAEEVTTRSRVSLPICSLETTNILVALPVPNNEAFDGFTWDEAEKLEQDTQKQSESNTWKQRRQGIFTASKFGQISKRRKAFDESFFGKLWNNNIDHLPAIKYGRREEDNAKAAYENQTKNKVHPVGLIIHPYAPHLGASPDGVVFDEKEGWGLLEIKCPLSKKALNLNESLKTKGYYLKRNENKAELKRNHEYFYQVQGQMLLAGLMWCDFCVYFKDHKELFVERIRFDSNFCEEMYKKLTIAFNIYLSSERQTVDDV